MIFSPHQILVLEKNTTNIIEVLSVGVPAELSSDDSAAYVIAQVSAALKNMKLDGDIKKVSAEWEAVKGTNLSDYDKAGKFIRPALNPETVY